jgi:predicted DCC family thiol-disulfide oxidoreductase YuxK
MSPKPAPPLARLVTLIDGDCALCSGYARFVSAADTRGRVYFETQQSDAGKAMLRRAGMPLDLSTIVTLESAPTGSGLRGQGLTLVPNSAQLELFCPPYNPT